MLLSVALLISATVVSRYFLGQPLTAFFELSEYAIVVITMLASPLLVRENGHIKMDLLAERLDSKHVLMRVTTWFSSIVVLVVCANIAYFAVKVALSDLRSGTTTASYMAPPRWSITVIMALGGVGLAVEAARRVVNLALGRIQTEATPDVSKAL